MQDARQVKDLMALCIAAWDAFARPGPSHSNLDCVRASRAYGEDLTNTVLIFWVAHVVLLGTVYAHVGVCKPGLRARALAQYDRVLP